MAPCRAAVADWGIITHPLVLGAIQQLSEGFFEFPPYIDINLWPLVTRLACGLYGAMS